MKKTELQSLVQECIAEVLNEKYSEFQRVDKGEKDVAAKDKAEEDTYGAGYAAGEKAAKAKYKKLAEAYKQLKEEGFGLNKDPYESKEVDEARFPKGTDIGKPGKGFEKIAKAAEKQYGSEEAGKKVAGAILKKVLKKEGEEQLNEVDMQEILPALIASGVLSTAAVAAIKQAIKDPQGFIKDVKKQAKNPGSIGPQ